jgi:hypothetical protein
MSNSNNSKHWRQKQNGENDEQSPLFENYKAGTSLALGMAVSRRKIFYQWHTTIGAEANVGQILGLAFWTEHEWLR